MAVKIILHNKGKSKAFSDPSENPNFSGPTLEINVRKNIRGDFMIMDHADVDIVYSGKTHKVTAFAKNVNVNADLVYDAQNRLFQFLSQRGVVDPESVQGGSLYSSMEADVFKENEVQENQVVLFTIGRFIEQERPFFKWKEAFRDNFIDKHTEPDDEHSTDLGDVPHGDRKGQVDPSGWLSGAAYQIYENKEVEANRRELEMSDGWRFFGVDPAEWNSSAGYKENAINVAWSIGFEQGSSGKSRTKTLKSLLSVAKADGFENDLIKAFKDGEKEGSGQLYEGKEISPEDVEFAKRIYARNKEFNKPSWALLNSGKLAKIWDMPDNNMNITVSWDGGKTWDGYEGMADIPLRIVKQVIWYDIEEEYVESAPAIKPLHIEMR